MADIETIGDAFIAAVVIVFVIVIVVAAIVYAIIKKKTSYSTRGIPKRIDDPREHEGSTDDSRACGADSFDDYSSTEAGPAEARKDGSGVNEEDGRIE